MVKRNLQAIAELSCSRFPAVAILGPRQVGKTTLVKGMHDRGSNFTYLDLENPQDQHKLTDSFSYLSSVESNCVILDEVQLRPELFSILRPLIDSNRRPGRFILLGSASPELIKGVSESLAGRVAYLELGGINIAELGESFSMMNHWFVGGFPLSLLAATCELSREWLNLFIRSYVERDLAWLFKTDLSPQILRNFWTMLAHSNGNIWSAELFARSLGISAPTVLRYLNFLEGAFMVRRLPAWFVNVKKRLVKSPKIYIRDSGLAHRLLAIPDLDSLIGHPAAGGSWEGYVIEQIHQNKPAESELFYYRTQVGAECDLLIVRGMEIMACIEIKFSTTPAISKGFLISCEDLQPHSRFLVTPGQDIYPLAHNVKVAGLRPFLKELLPNI